MKNKTVTWISEIDGEEQTETTRDILQGALTLLEGEGITGGFVVEGLKAIIKGVKS